jgi:hypothetical protein
VNGDVEGRGSRSGEDGWGDAEVVVETVISALTKETKSSLGIVYVGKADNAINTVLDGGGLGKTMTDDGRVIANDRC